MKVPNKIKTQKQKHKRKPKDNKKEQVLMVAQEFKFAWLLSSNEKKTRDRVLKTLKKWFQHGLDKKHELESYECPQPIISCENTVAELHDISTDCDNYSPSIFSEDSFIRVWKGLFNAVWMADKPLDQEELCEDIARILDLFPPNHLEDAVRLTKAGLKVLATKWYGIDQHRMDKFLMLVRRYLRGSLRCLLRCNWTLQSCHAYSKMLMDSDGILCTKTPQYARNAVSLILHVIDCFLEELAKVSKGNIPEDSLAALLQPFTALVCGGETLVLCVAARRLLTALLRQSDSGLQYQEASRAWQKMGCPAGGPEALELVISDVEENGDEECMDEPSSALDPRAGRVDVLLPQIPVPAALLADQLRNLMTKISSKAYKRASICLERFEALSKNKYPLVVSEAEASGLESPLPAAVPQQAAQRLRALEKTLVSQSDELALRGLKRKHRKRLLARSRAGLSIIDEVAQITDTRGISTNGDWRIEEIEPKKELKSKQGDSSNKENEVIKGKANRKRKALENGIDKGKKVKSVDIIDDKNKVSVKSKDSEKKLNSDKNKSTVNGNSNKDKLRINKGSKLKLGESDINEKIKSQERVVKNSPKLIESHKQTGKPNKSDKLSVSSDKEGYKNDLLSNKQVRAELTNTVKMTSDANKLTKRQKVLPMNKIKNYQKQTSSDKESSRKKVMETPKKVKFVLKNNGIQGTIDYYKSVRQSPNIPFDSSKRPSKTNLKVSTPSPINPFFKKKLKMKF